MRIVLHKVVLRDNRWAMHKTPFIKEFYKNANHMGGIIVHS